MAAELIESIVKILFIFGVNIGFFSPILGWVERKQSAVMQDRVGANRADVFGFTIDRSFSSNCRCDQGSDKRRFYSRWRRQTVSYPCTLYKS